MSGQQKLLFSCQLESNRPNHFIEGRAYVRIFFIAGMGSHPFQSSKLSILQPPPASSATPSRLRFYLFFPAPSLQMSLCPAERARLILFSGCVGAPAQRVVFQFNFQFVAKFGRVVERAVYADVFKFKILSLVQDGHRFT